MPLERQLEGTALRSGKGGRLVVLALLTVMGIGPGAPAGAAAEPEARPPAPTERGIVGDLAVQLDRMDATEAARVIVRLDDSPTDAHLAGLRRHVGRFAIGQRLGIVNGFEASLTKGQIVALSRLPEVRSIEQDAAVHAANDSAQASFGVTQARIDAGVDGDADGNAASYSAADLVAAVVDTGIDTRHLDLDDGKVLAF